MAKQQLLTCGHCRRNFCYEAQVRQHIRTTHKSNPASSCPRCHQNFDRGSRLDEHLAKQQLLTCGHCRRNFCFEAQVRQHILSEHAGSGIGTDRQPQSPTELSVPIIGVTGYEEQPGHQNMMHEHESIIQPQTRDRTDWKKMNIQIPPSFSYADLRSILNDIMTGEKGKAFKINLGFGCMLYHTINRVFRYYYVSTNHFLFNRAYTISSHSDMTDFFNKIYGLDIANRYYMQRPSSGWVLAGVPNLEIRIYRFHNIPIGAPTDLPAYIKKSKSIKALTHHKSKGYVYEDNFCFFRCLALCLKANIKGLKKLVLNYKKKLEAETGKNYDDGVTLDDLEEIEKVFQVNINVYSLQED